VSPARSRIFLSHAAVDRPLAELLRDRIVELDPTRRVFVASRPGDIRADQEWLPTIQQELAVAEVYIVLLTPNSIARPWVWFETGAAWMSQRTLIAVRAAGLASDEVPLPLSTRQILSLDNPNEAVEIFRAIGLQLRDERDFTNRVIELGHAAITAGIRETGWKGIEVGTVFYAWDGPLTNLEDFKPEPEPPGLLDALRQQGLTCGWANRDKLARRGLGERLRVYATDRRKWRREIVNGDTVLVVSGPSATPELRAFQFQEQQQLREERDRFLRSCESVQLAQRELTIIHASLESKVAKIRDRAPILQPYFRRTEIDCVVRLGRASARLAWNQKYVDSILDAELVLTEADGMQQLDMDSALISRQPKVLRTIRFVLAETPDENWHWRRLGGAPDTLSSAMLADFVLGLLMERIEGK
jgi:hypothetical protein